MNRISRTTIICVLILISMSRANAQAPAEPRTAMRELYKLQAMFDSDTSIGFDCTYFLEDVDSVTTLDSMAGSFKFFAGTYRILMDSVEQVQDSNLNVTLYRDNDIMMVRNPTSFTNYVFHANVLDSFFMDATDSVTLYDSGAYSKIRFHFKPMMPFVDYEVVYDTTNYYIYTIKCSFRKSIPTPSEMEMISDNKRINFRVYYYNHSRNIGSRFSTDHLVQFKNGAYVPKSPYNNYQLVNSINQ